MNSDSFWQALAWVLVIEGLLPFLSPRNWRAMFAQILAWGDGQIRFFGLCSIAAGLIVMTFLG